MVTTRSRHRLIERDHRIHGGEPVIRGTRVPIRSIVLSLREDDPSEPPAVAAAYRISLAAVEAALDYYRAHEADIKRVIK